MMPRTRTPYHDIYNADTVLDAVDAWVRNRSGYLIRETGQVVKDGRLDGLIIPAGFATQVPVGLTGVEVKISRGDFQRGLAAGQYEKYARELNALYIATPYDVVKTSGIPKEYGHLIVSVRRDDPVCVCRRHAPWRNYMPDQNTIWRLVFDLLDQQQREQRENQKNIYRLRENICAIAVEKIRALLPNELPEAKR